ncbi:hypothetical protein [Dictyobacter aurantiacus]|uniref:Uncharacterized protein n=1 Tax=Dictyobacter aurantiacus TaxID=1936993 RepID=A0A401ZD48_9CHLR|nr:hypothetical protein [Dictyobacter aurantiacus]GCE04772.1 hypothetical protein KDAU_21010 [Dictyobacter aurantiacus]
MPYKILYSNVDGAGSMKGTWEKDKEAIQAANALQERSDMNGNPWMYQYHVVDEQTGRTMHRTKSRIS